MDVIEGWGQFVSGRELEIDGRRSTAETFVIATGPVPVAPPIPGLEETGYLTDRTIFEIERLPARLAVIGGGPIGLELGQALQRLGAEVTLIEAMSQVLPRAEAPVAEMLSGELRRERIDVRLDTRVDGVGRDDGCARLQLSDRDGRSDLDMDEVLVAVGQRPNVTGLNLEAAGVERDEGGGIHVDRQLRTTNKRIYAYGDAIGGRQFTHVAAYEAGMVLKLRVPETEDRLSHRAMGGVHRPGSRGGRHKRGGGPSEARRRRARVHASVSGGGPGARRRTRGQFHPIGDHRTSTQAAGDPRSLGPPPVN